MDATSHVLPPPLSHLPSYTLVGISRNVKGTCGAKNGAFPGPSARPGTTGNIGRPIIRRTIDAAFAFGLTRIELTVRQGNANAIALYKSLGFEIEGLHRNAVCIDGQFENLHSMALLRV
jgi:hypothetical protein